MKKKKKVAKPRRPVKKIEPAVEPPRPPPPPLMMADPEATRKRNEEWFASLKETVGTVEVVPPPLAGPPITVIPGFTVACVCKKSPMYPSWDLPVKCEKCGGKGFVVIQKG